ncbi:MAG: branched-chain amino acid transport system substrate-binding protein [Actinomycetota bacterium]|nr:branched-chain amino acid transport system substrate-binding protein [Actinomycetota bacterium]
MTTTDGAGTRRRTFKKTAVGILAALSLVSAGCGTRTSDAELKALLSQNASQTGTASGALPGDAATATGSDAGAVSGSAEGALSSTGGAAATGAGSATGGSSSGAGSYGAGSSSGGASASKSAAGKAAGTAGAGASSSAAGGPAAKSAASAGPSGSAGGASTPAAPGAAVPAGKCSGSEPPLPIASVGSYSGILGAVFINSVKSLRAWASLKNAGGGINCHKVNLLFGDDQGDPARNQALVRKFVEEDRVIALVFNAAPFSDRASVDYLNQKKIPFIGQGGGSMHFYSDPMSFPLFPSGIYMQMVTIASGAQVYVPQGMKKIAIATCTEGEYCNVAPKTFGQVAQQLGFEVVYEGKASLTQPDMTSMCLQARNAGAQVFVTSFDSQTNERLLNSCAKVNYKPGITVANLQAQADFPKNPNAEGGVLGMVALPWTETTQPAMAEYLGALKKYAPDTALESNGEVGWLAGKGFERAARDIPPTKVPTNQDILDGLYSFTGETLGDLTYPLTFRQGQPVKTVACGYPMVVSGGKWTSRPKFCMKGLEP